MGDYYDYWSKEEFIKHIEGLDDDVDLLKKEVDRLTSALRIANRQAAECEREMYLAMDREEIALRVVNAARKIHHFGVDNEPEHVAHFVMAVKEWEDAILPKAG